MDIRQCYDTLGGDYNEVLGRMMNSESMLQRFLLKFPADQSYELLMTALENGDGQTAFRAAHTLKGVCQNLSLGKLAAVASELTELLRSGVITEAVAPMAEQVTEAYRLTVDTIAAYQKQVAG